MRNRHVFGRCKIPMNLQFFAEDNTGSDGTGGGSSTESTTSQSTETNSSISATETNNQKEQTTSTNEPVIDVGVLQTQLAQANVVNQQLQIQNAAILQAMQLGLDAKTIPYILKMADLGKAMGKDGKINNDTLKNALNKVIEDIPALKPQTTASTGFVQIGAASGQQRSQSELDAQLDRIFGVKKK